jgi:hypothetical protein
LVVKLLTLLAGAALLVTACASSGTDAATAVADGEEKVCRSERELGSNRIERVCKTRTQIEAEKEAASDNLDRLDRNRTTTPATGGIGG